MPLTAQTPLKTFIDDFIKSDDPRFEGKSKKKRIEMATSAYYSKQNEDLESSIESYSIEELQEFLDEETLDEISRNALGSYINKAAGEVAVNAASMALAKHRVTADTLQHTNIKRTAGIAKAVKKLAEPGKDNKTGDYIHNAVKDMDIKAYSAAHEKDDEKFDALDRGIENRKAGIARAVDKEKIVKSGNALFDRAQPIAATRKRNAAKNEEVEELDELSTDKLADYKTKAAKDAGEADKSGDLKRGDKRFSGIVKATNKQFDNDAKARLTKEDLDESGEKKSKHVSDVINSIRSGDQPTKEKHLAYLKSIMDSADYAHIEKLLKTEDRDMNNEEIEALDENKFGVYKGLEAKLVKTHPTLDAAKKHAEELQGSIGVLHRAKEIKEEVEELDELSKGTLGNYVKAAAKDIHRNVAQADVFHDTQSQLNVKNRKAGIVKAIDRLTKEAVEESSKGETPPTAKQKKVSDAFKKKAVGNKEELQRISDAFALKKEDLDENEMTDKEWNEMRAKVQSAPKVKPTEEQLAKATQARKDRTTDRDPDLFNRLDRVAKLTKEDLDGIDDETFATLSDAFEEEFGESIEEYFELSEEEIDEGDLSKLANTLNKQFPNGDVKVQDLRKDGKPEKKENPFKKVGLKVQDLRKDEEIEEGVVIPFVSKKSKSDRAAKDEAGTAFVKAYVKKNLPGVTMRPTSKHESFFDAIQSDKLSEAKESLEDILAEKVVAKLLELKEAIAKGRGTPVSPYHDTYRSALEGAYKHANDMGFDVHEDDQDTSSVDPKPSVGQTRSLHFRLLKDGKEHKKQLHAQVYNRGSEEGRPNSSQYELNHYIA